MRINWLDNITYGVYLKIFMWGAVAVLNFVPTFLNQQGEQTISSKPLWIKFR